MLRPEGVRCGFRDAGMELTRSLQCATLTHPGRVRSLNEDSVEVRVQSGLVLLADGMGGYKAGEVASGMAVELIGSGLHEDWLLACSRGIGGQPLREQAHHLVREHIARANRAIFDRAQSDTACSGMGTTLVLALFYDNVVTVAHIGDSRMYRLRGEELSQVTRDHSLLQEQIDSGILTPQQARNSLNKNLVTRALGVDESVEAEVKSYAVEPGDVYLLCSDGLNDMVEDDAIRGLLVEHVEQPETAATRLVDAANEGGGRDNVTVALVRVTGDFALDNPWLNRVKGWFGRN